MIGLAKQWLIDVRAAHLRPFKRLWPEGDAA